MGYSLGIPRDGHLGDHHHTERDLWIFPRLKSAKLTPLLALKTPRASSQVSRPFSDAYPHEGLICPW